MRQDLIDKIKQDAKKNEAADFRVGDDIRVSLKIKEGDKERIQIFEGSVIAMKKSGSETIFTVRKISFGEGVERTFSLSSPRIEKTKVVRRGHVRRAKLYYLRDKVGKKSKIKAKSTS